MLDDLHHERDTQDEPPWRMTSRLTVEAARFIRLAVSRIDESEAIPREISSRSARVRARGDRRRAAGRIPPRGNKTDRMQLCSLPKARPTSCSDCPAFQRFQTSTFSITESPNLFPGRMPTPPFEKNRFTSDGVASTYRMRRPYRTCEILNRHLFGDQTTPAGVQHGDSSPSRAPNSGR